MHVYEKLLNSCKLVQLAEPSAVRPPELTNIRHGLKKVSKNIHIMGKVLWDLDSRKNILMKIRIFQTQKMKAELKADKVKLELRTKDMSRK